MRKGEVWFVEIPASDGREQAGARPVIILSEVKNHPLKWVACFDDCLT